MRNIKLTIEYDGTKYCGWQRQNNVITIEEKIENAILLITKEKVSIIGASRTDAGVHAKGQVANFFTESNIPVENITMALNSKLPKDIAILDTVEVPENFHSRYSCLGKSYTYTILNRKVHPSYLKDYVAFYSYNLDISAMCEAIKLFEGTHDFSAFQSKGSSVRSSTRTMNKINLKKDGEFIYLYFEANGFLYNMVRIIVGTLVDVGRGKYKPEKIKEILELKERSLAGKTAPASGLCLEKIFY